MNALFKILKLNLSIQGKQYFWGIWTLIKKITNSWLVKCYFHSLQYSNFLDCFFIIFNLTKQVWKHVWPYHISLTTFTYRLRRLNMLPAPGKMYRYFEIWNIYCIDELNIFLCKIYRLVMLPYAGLDKFYWGYSSCKMTSLENFD